MNLFSSFTQRPPRAGRSSAVGATFDAGVVRVVELSDKGKTLKGLGEAPLPAGAMAGGEVHDAEVVGRALAEAMSAAGVTSKRIELAVAGPRVALRLLEVPDMPEAELRASLGFQVGDVLPFPVADTIIDFQPVGFLEGADGKRTRQVLVIASHREQIRGYLEAARVAGLSVASIDSAPLALGRSMSGLLASYDPATGAAPVEGIVHVGADVTSVVVSAGGTTLFGRTLGAGTEAGGLELEADPDAVADRLFPLMEDIRNTLAFAISQVARERLSRVLLVADAAIEPVLVECLQATIGVPVQPVWVTHLADARGTRGADSVDGSYAVPYALAMNRLAPPTDHVPSLLPPEVFEEAKRRRQVMLAGAGVASVAAGLALVTVVHAGLVVKANHDLAKRQKDEKALMAKIAELKDVEDTAAKVGAKQVAVRGALAGSTDVPRLLNDIADHLPGDTVLKNISITDAGVEMQLEGTSKDAPAEALEALSRSTRLRGLWLPQVSYADAKPASTNADGNGTAGAAAGGEAATAAPSATFHIKGFITPAAATGRAVEFEVKK